MTRSTVRPKVDISDREAAADRYSRLAIIDGLLRDLGDMAKRDPRYPWRNVGSPEAEERRRELDWLGDLPEGFDIDGDSADAIGEANALWDALWPMPEDGSDWQPEPEFEAAEARVDVMTARLLLRIAEHPEWLREVALERLKRASHLIDEAGAALNAVEQLAREHSSGSAKDISDKLKGGDDA